MNYVESEGHRFWNLADPMTSEAAYSRLGKREE